MYFDRPRVHDSCLVVLVLLGSSVFRNPRSPSPIGLPTLSSTLTRLIVFSPPTMVSSFEGTFLILHWNPLSSFVTL